VTSITSSPSSFLIPSWLSLSLLFKVLSIPTDGGRLFGVLAPAQIKYYLKLTDFQKI
jgi:hypothetical protein